MGPLDQTEVVPGVFYVVHPHHRDPHQQNDKSQWTITPSEERDVFSGTVMRRWFAGTVGWGLHIPNGAAEYLGTGRAPHCDARLRRLFMAKFVRDAVQPSWHGYPSDHQRHPSNVPPEPVLKAWADSGFLRWATMAKVLKGRPCSL